MHGSFFNNNYRLNMMETKLSLTIILPGRTMFSKKECLKTTRK